MKNTVTILLLCSSIVAFAQQRDFDNIFPNTDKTSPGGIILKVEDGKKDYLYTSGMADISNEKLNSESTLFWIASVTKQFTAYGVFLLEEDGKLNRNEPVRKYLPLLPEIANTITIADLLKHRSGLRDGFVLCGLSLLPESEYTNENVFKMLCQQKEMNFTPGTKYEYNNSNYVLLAMIIEKVSGMQYPEYMQEKVFKKLNMTNSFISAKVPLASENFSRGYTTNKDGKFIPLSFTGNTYGSTGMVTTATDLVIWGKHLNKLLRNGYWNSIEENDFYDMGLERHKISGKTIYAHFGSDPGYKAQFILNPSEKIILIGLTNFEQCYRLYEGLYENILTNKFHIKKSAKNFNSLISVKDGWYINKNQTSALKVKQRQNIIDISESENSHAKEYLWNGKTFTNTGVFTKTISFKNNNLIFFNEEEKSQIIMEALPSDLNSMDINKYSGSYYSPETFLSYSIKENEGILTLEFMPGLAFNFEQISPTLFVGQVHGQTLLRFEGKNLYLSLTGVQNLKLEKK